VELNKGEFWAIKHKPWKVEVGREGRKRETGKRRGVRSRNKRPRVGVMRRLLVGCRVQKVTGERRLLKHTHGTH
jgi:hypothetical protein